MSATASKNARLQAVNALTRVYTKGLTLDQVLDTETTPLVRELVTGTLRYHYSLSFRVDQMLTRTLRKKDTDVKALLLLGAYQLVHMRIPAHAAVAETVQCANALRKSWAKGLVNAVLRNLPLSTQGATQGATANDTLEPLPESVRYEHPDWFIKALRSSLPNHWQAVLSANNTRAPMSLRINQQRTSVADYSALLASAKLEFSPGPLPETLILDAPKPQTSLPGFDNGLVAVQDSAAQLAVALSQPKDGARVLDACAAPGGKGFHLLERYPAIHLQMQDSSETRVATLTAQAQRLGHLNRAGKNVVILQADSTKPAAVSESPWDLILLDAPCSGSGTVRRHPDIKILRDANSPRELNGLQSALLAALWLRLAPGGRLVYSTCSLFREENDAIISAFLSRHSTIDTRTPSAPEVDLAVLATAMPQHAGVRTEFGWQTLPTEGGGDGLYYCVLKKAADNSIAAPEQQTEQQTEQPTEVSR